MLSTCLLFASCSNDANTRKSSTDKSAQSDAQLESVENVENDADIERLSGAELSSFKGEIGTAVESQNPISRVQGKIVKLYGYYIIGKTKYLIAQLQTAVVKSKIVYAMICISDCGRYPATKIESGSLVVGKEVQIVGYVSRNTNYDFYHAISVNAVKLPEEPSLEQEAKTNLSHIFTLQEAYFADYDKYASFNNYGPEGSCRTITPIGFRLEKCESSRLTYSLVVVPGGYRAYARSKDMTFVIDQTRTFKSYDRNLEREAHTILSHLYTLEVSYFADTGKYSPLLPYGPAGSCETSNDIGFRLDDCKNSKFTYVVQVSAKGFVAYAKSKDLTFKIDQDRNFY
jgi:hypothetical protein